MAARLTGVGTEIDPARLGHPTLAFLLDYWKAKRGARMIPSRCEISPAELKEHLGWVIVASSSPDYQEFRYRLIGTLVTQYFLDDATGKTVTEAWAGSPREVGEAVRAIYRKCARDRVVVRSYGDAGWLGDGYEGFDSLYLPLSGGGDSAEYVLSAFVFDRTDVLISRQIARGNGGRLPLAPPRLKTTAG